MEGALADLLVSALRLPLIALLPVAVSAVDGLKNAISFVGNTEHVDREGDECVSAALVWPAVGLEPVLDAIDLPGKACEIGAAVIAVGLLAIENALSGLGE
jgi:hypothetical protein